MDKNEHRPHWIDETQNFGEIAQSNLEKALANSRDNENPQKVKRSELWNEIFSIVKQIPRKEVMNDCVDAYSATTMIEELIKRNLKLV